VYFVVSKNRLRNATASLLYQCFQLCVGVRKDVSWIWGSYSGDFEMYSLLECSSVESGSSPRTFRRSVFPSSPGKKVSQPRMKQEAGCFLVGLLLSGRLPDFTALHPWRMFYERFDIFNSFLHIFFIYFNPNCFHNPFGFILNNCFPSLISLTEGKFFFTSDSFPDHFLAGSFHSFITWVHFWYFSYNLQWQAFI
jgi:hypothetical protein